jgi:hypothetical protein
MLDDPHAPRKRRTRKKAPQLPAGDGATSGGAAAKTSKGAGLPNSSRRIEGGYVLEADGSVGFWIGKHDPGAALVIDPSLTLTYETFLGGTGADAATSIALDPSGNVYLGGTTTSASSFPEGANAIQDSERGQSQLFIAKVAFSSSGIGTLEYLTFFGGSASQAGGQVAIDPSGNAAVLGVTTSQDYPVTDASTPTLGLTQNDGNDVVVSEIDPTGSNLIFSTLFGGSGAESHYATSGIALTASQNIPAAEGGIAFDASGNVYVASDTTSQDLPTTGTSFQPAFGGKGNSDGFLAEFQPQNVASGTSDVLYCSYLGTSADQQVAVGGVAVDGAAPPNVYVAGSTTNDIDPFPGKGAVQSTYGGDPSDAFVMEIAPVSGGTSDLIYATLLGGSGLDEALGLAVDTQTPANAYVVGATQSPSFPEQPTVAGPSIVLHAPSEPGALSPQNAFLAVVAWNPATSQTQLQYLTYLGGSANDAAQSVDAIFSNTVYVGGTSTSYDFGWHDNLQAFNGVSDAFVAKLDTTKAGASSLIYATPLGGTFFTPNAPAEAFGNGIAADGNGDVYIAGGTTAPNFPSAQTSSLGINGFQQVCGSCQETPTAEPDAFLAAIREVSTAKPAVSFNAAQVATGQGILVGSGSSTNFFSIANSGDASLQITTPVVVAGSNASDFKVILSGGCLAAISPGANPCQAQVTFTPSVAGNEAAVIAISDNAPGSPQLLEVTGSGGGSVQVSPASFTFQNAAVNTASPQKIAVTVTAGVAITGLTITPDPGNLGPFQPAQLEPSCFTNTSLPTGGTCYIEYEFTPTTTGTFQGNIDVNYHLNGVAGPEQKVPLIGTAVPAAPVANVRPSQMGFGSEAVGAITGEEAVVVANTGVAPLDTQGIEFGGSDPGDFLESNDCPANIAPNTSCTVYVQFSPQSPGNRSASLTITDNASGSPQSVQLTGTGTALPQVQLAPTSWGFGTVSVGATSAAEQITITNVGSAAVAFTQIAVSGTNAGDFSESNNCPTAIAIGAFCTATMQFSPQAAGSRSAALTIGDNASGSPQKVQLAGTGAASAELQFAPPTYAFGSIGVGASSAATPITITNSGTVPLSISQIAITGTNAGSFAESNNCPVAPLSLASGGQCVVNATFTPTIGGSLSASLTVTDNAPESPQSAAFTGTGIAASQVQFTPTSFGFGSASVGAVSVSEPITITNTGTAALSINQIAITGANASDFAQSDNCGPILVAGGQCVANVTFTPTAGGNRSAALTVTDNAAGSPQTAALNGSGLQANASLSATSLSFTSQPGTASAPQAITVTSSGPGQPLSVTKVTISGTNPAEFTDSDNCIGSISTNCAIHVTFTPACSSAATRSATITIQDNGATSPQTVQLSGQVAGDFCLGMTSGTTQSVAAGSTANFPPIAVTPIGNFTGTVNITCSAAPAGPVCSEFPSTSIALQPNVPENLEIQVSTATSSSFGSGLRPNWRRWIWPTATVFEGLVALVALALMTILIPIWDIGGCGRRRRLALAGITLALLCLGTASCGGGGGGSAPAATATQLSGTFAISVTASDANQTQTLPLQLNVTQ